MDNLVFQHDIVADVFVDSPEKSKDAQINSTLVKLYDVTRNPPGTPEHFLNQPVCINAHQTISGFSHFQLVL
jgi:hypothetical protein